MEKYILALDQGTTSSRAVLFDRNGTKVFAAQYEFPQIFPRAGWVEHSPADILDSQMKAIFDCIYHLKSIGASAEDIAAIGVANQRETTVVWDKSTGKPVYNAIVWQCRRTAEYCSELEQQGLGELFRDRTGLLIDPYFSATKLKWILDNVDGARDRAQKGELLFGTVDTWLIWNLSGGKVHITDRTNASRTMLFNIHTLEWDREILKLFDIPECMLAEISDSSGDLCVTEKALFGATIPVSSCVGDQQAALFGQCCFHKGDVKNTYGTGGFLLMNTGKECIRSKNGMLTTVAWSIDGEVTYALEGSVFVSGAVIKWLRDELGLIRSADETAETASSITDNGGVYFVPAFVGLGAPYWDSGARGQICGLTRGTGKAHIVRAALEAIAYQTADVINAMEDDTSSLNLIKADGGASRNTFLMQFQADILGRSMICPDDSEATALGAAYLAGLRCGMWSSPDELEALPRKYTEYIPSIPDEKRRELISGWKDAVNRTLGR